MRQRQGLPKVHHCLTLIRVLRFDQPMLISVKHDVLRVLADPLRARIAEILAEGPACTCHLVTDLETTQSNVSNHLRVLRQAGIVVAEPYGRYTYYRLRPELLEDAAEHLAKLAQRAQTTTGARRSC